MTVTVAELCKRLEQQAADAEAMHASAPVADVLRVVLAELATVNGTAQDSGSDRLLSAADVAARLNVSTRYVYDHANEWPFTQRLSARKLRFSERGLERWERRTRSP